MQRGAIVVSNSQRCVLLLLTVFMLMFTTIGAFAQESTLERIYRTGELRIGLRESAPPFGYLAEDGKHAGLSVDMAYLLAEKVSEWAGKPIQVREVPVTPATRLPAVSSGIVDVEMGSTSITGARELAVDFTIPFFISETQFIVKADSGITSMEDLSGKIIGASEGTTNLQALHQVIDEGIINPQSLATSETHAKGFLSLQQGRIDAYFTDASLLAGLRASAPNPDEYVIVQEAIHLEPYAWMVPENDSAWRDFVNHFFLWTLETGQFFETYDKWLGPDTDTYIPRTEAYEHYLAMIHWPGILDVWPGKR